MQLQYIGMERKRKKKKVDEDVDEDRQRILFEITDKPKRDLLLGTCSSRNYYSMRSWPETPCPIFDAVTILRKKMSESLTTILKKDFCRIHRNFLHVVANSIIEVVVFS